MKKLLLLLSVLLTGAVLNAEPVRNGERGVGDMIIWRSSSPISSIAPVFISSSAYLHEVIVSSPALVHTSTDSVLTIYAETPPSEVEYRSIAGVSQSTRIARIQLSTHAITGDQFPMRWTFDTFVSSAITIGLSSTTSVSPAVEPPFVTLVYQDRALPSNYKVWSSTFISVGQSTHTLTKGPVILHKLSVFDKASGIDTHVKIHNCHATQGDTCSTDENLITRVDISTFTGELDYDILLSSGLTVVSEASNGDIGVFYKTNFGSDFEYWIPEFASGTVESNSDNSRIVTHGSLQGRVVFGGFLNGSIDQTSKAIVYDQIGNVDASTTSALSPYLGEINDNNKIGHAVGRSVFDFDDARYEVYTSSGIGILTEGNGQWTIRYRKIR